MIFFLLDRGKYSGVSLIAFSEGSSECISPQYLCLPGSMNFANIGRRPKFALSSYQTRTGLQIRDLKYQSSSSKFQNFELANLRTFLNFRTSPYHFPAIYQFSKNAAFWKNPEKIWPKFSKNSANLAKFARLKIFAKKKTAKNSAIFNEKIEIRERCKGVHCVDLGESFPTSIYLQNLASIQPRTSPVKFTSSNFEI